MGRYGLNHENEIIYKSIDNIMILAKYIFFNLQPFSETEPVSFCFISLCHQLGCNHVVFRNICVCVPSRWGRVDTIFERSLPPTQILIRFLCFFNLKWMESFYYFNL